MTRPRFTRIATPLHLFAASTSTGPNSDRPADTLTATCDETEALKSTKVRPMTLTKLEKIALGLSGLTAIGIGGMITLFPQDFYASYGIDLGADPSLLSELRAPGAGLTTLGVLMLLGIWRSTLAALAVAATLVVFLAFPAGRFIGLAIDGMPSSGILGALILELAIAALCVFAFQKRFTSRSNQP